VGRWHGLGPNNADGIVGTADGGLLFARELALSGQGKLDTHDRDSAIGRHARRRIAYLSDARGANVDMLYAVTDSRQAGRGITAPCTEPRASRS
jgi:hypothetical protein